MEKLKSLLFDISEYSLKRKKEVCVLVAQSCLFANSSTVGPYVAMEFSRQENWNGLPFPSFGDLPWPRDRTWVSHIAGRFFTNWATREAQEQWSGWPIPSSGELTSPGIKQECPALQADSLPAELPGKPGTKTKSNLPHFINTMFH